MIANRKSSRGGLLIYLNNAAQGYPISSTALDAFMQVANSPPTGARHSVVSRVELARETVTRILQLRDAQITFGSNATHSINTAIQGFMVSGGHCIVDNRSHNSVLRCLTNRPDLSHTLVALHGLNETLDISALLDAICHETRLVCINHVSNVTGSVYDVGLIIQAVRDLRQDVAILVDASQSAGLIDLNDALEADFIVFPGHKHLHSLPGSSVLISRQALRPYIFGGTGTESAVLDVSKLSPPPLEVGTLNEPAVHAFAQALAEAVSVRSSTRQHDISLTGYFLERLKEVPEFKLIGRDAAPDRIGVVSLSPSLGHPELDWVPFLSDADIVVRGGLHCAPSIHDQFELVNGGTLRVSISKFNTTDDIDQFIDVSKDFFHSLKLVA